MCARQLFLIRHAKSSWSDSSLRDIERPLNKRGNRDASFMAELLKEKNIKPDLILSSSSVRTRSTAQYFVDQLMKAHQAFKIESRLYEASASTILNVINGTPVNVSVLMLFGHNPGLTSLHNFISAHYIDNIPTCGICCYSISADWRQIKEKSCELEYFEYPKKYFE